ncbi:MAG: ADP-forming succinate--CoA ligase subunit beta [Candidatus Omnitrophica bacterium]|nr:ADP-forming succinate--CoA ligase subunit beta [Candidatus Omnitrophota bacterium]
MNIHEYQAKAIFQKFGLRIPPGKVFDQNTLSLDQIRSIGPKRFAVKAQVHAGGRGKAGGIKIVETAEEAFQAAKSMLGTTLVTYQTAGAAKPIDHVLIETTSQIAHELYLAIALDREAALPCVIGSRAGGVDIETVARETPEEVIKFHFDPDWEFTPKLFEPVVSKLKKALKDLEERAADLALIISKLGKLFVAMDASLVEVNPLGLMADGSLLPIDAKITFDDNGLFRHPELLDLHDPRQEDPREVEAKTYDLSYVGLDGNIGCMVNGAGLAMATMDIIKLNGGEPANFLDVGGGASKEKVAAAFKIILKDPRVKAILVNIFGGIMRCDVIAEGILAALEEIDLQVPLVVRLEGTNVEEGKAILAKSKVKLIAADSFADAAVKVVGLAS